MEVTTTPLRRTRKRISTAPYKKRTPGNLYTRLVDSHWESGAPPPLEVNLILPETPEMRNFLETHYRIPTYGWEDKRVEYYYRYLHSEESKKNLWGPRLGKPLVCRRLKFPGLGSLVRRKQLQEATQVFERLENLQLSGEIERPEGC